MKTKPKIPSLRFPEFQEEWANLKMSELTKRIVHPVKVSLEEDYQQIGIRSHGKGIFYKEIVNGKELGNKRVFWVEENCLILNIVFAWEQAVAKTTKEEIGMIASHRFPMYKPLANKADLDYLLCFFLTSKGKTLLELASPGGAGRNKTLGQSEFNNLKFLIPKIKEQVKISNFLNVLDDKINLMTKKKSLLEQYKKGITQKIFSQELRFKDDNGKKYPKWEQKSLGELLDYEQPTRYLVESTDYDDAFKIPVLTAGKSFILGYTNETKGIFEKGLPVIIFDDFTTSNHFVNFPFKVKSSAIKILSPKSGVNIYFIYEAMQSIQYTIGGHERHWISKYSKIEVPLPCPKEQEKIANFMDGINKKIALCQDLLQEIVFYRQGVLQKMFC